MTTEVKTNPRTDAFGPRNTCNRRRVRRSSHPRVLTLDGQILKLFRNLANHPLNTLVELFQFDSISVRKSDGDLTKLVDPSQARSIDIYQGDTELFDVLIDSRRRLLNPCSGCLTVASAPVDPMRVNDCLHDRTPKNVSDFYHKPILGVCNPENSDKFGIHRLILLKIRWRWVKFTAEPHLKRSFGSAETSENCRERVERSAKRGQRVDKGWFELREQPLDAVERRN